MDVCGARALVTGGAHRLGAALALALAQAGCDVAIGYRGSAEAAAATVETVRRAGVGAHAFQADVGVVAEARGLVERAHTALGGLDVLVHAASGGFRPSRPEEIDEALYDEALDSTLKGGFFCAQAAYRAMDGRGGVIVFVTDVAGLEAWPAFAAHSAAKAGLMSLTKTLARAWAPSVRVCAVCPGPVLLPDGAGAESQRRSAAETALGRLGEPGDIAQALLYLLAADYVTGTQLVVDGGHLLVGS
jgi:pteridine reductase